MNKTFKTILALALSAVAMTFASCSKNDDANNVPTQQEIETKIIGKWKRVSDNGIETVTNSKEVATFNADGTEIFSTSRFYTEYDRFFWVNKVPYNFCVQGNALVETMDESLIADFAKIILGPLEIPENKTCAYYSKVIDIDDNTYTCEFYKTVLFGSEIPFDNIICKMKKVTADYTQDIIGMWEGVEMTGYETYGNIEARIEYKADGTYTYYKKVDGEWQPLADVFDEYNVDGDWLATRWQNNGSDVMNYEWWDIDYIKDGTMKWSALREKEDGTRFTTTFTWKKVK